MADGMDHNEILRELRAEMTAIKGRHTRGGYINARDCVGVSDGFIDLLDYARGALDQEDFVLAFSIATLVQQNLVQLALTADDSYGGVTNGMWETYQVVDEICDQVESGSADAAKIFEMSIKQGQHKVFTGMESFVFEMLRRTARLAQPKNVRKLYALLDDLQARYEPADYWIREKDLVVRIQAIAALEGETAALEMIQANLKYREVRQLAIERAMENEDWAKAESLLQDHLNAQKEYRYLKEDYKLLFEILDEAGDEQRLEELARQLLIKEHDAYYYPKLKQILEDKEEWEDQIDDLLDELDRSLFIGDYLRILAQEDEVDLLLDKMRDFPEYIFEYAEQLVDVFPEETCQIYGHAILSMADQAGKRSKYRKVCQEIQNLVDLGGSDEAQEVVQRLYDRHGNQPAFMEELDLLADQLERRRRRFR